MTVIVGVDGSVGGYAAFSFAVDEAVRRRSGCEWWRWCI